MKKHKLLFRTPCFLLCLCMILAVFAGCAKDKTENDTTESVTDSVDTGPQYEYDEDGYVKDHLPDNLDMNRRDFKILQWQSYQPEFVTDAGTNNINQSLYYRISNVEERLKCYISVEFRAGDWGNMTTFLQTVYNECSADTCAYDLIGQYSFVAPTAAMYGCYANLSQVEHLDFDMPWWDSDLLASAQLSDKVYFATGDIAPTSIYQTFCMYFNHGIVTDYQSAHGYSVKDLYDLVLNGGWTLEVLQMMTKDVYKDENNNGTKDDVDFFGFDIFDNPHYDAFFYASDMRIIEKDTDGSFILSNGFTGMKSVNLIDELRTYFQKDEVFEGNGSDAFRSNRAMFALTTFNYPINKLTDVTFQYGVLPVPKYDSEQSNYRTTLAAPYTLYSIPVRCQSVSEAGALMEALASDGYRNVSPVIYEEALKLRYAGDYSENAQIYDLIRASRVYDVGRIYGNIMSNEGSGAAFALFRNAVIGSLNWGSTLNSMKPVYNTQLGIIEDAFAKFN